MKNQFNLVPRMTVLVSMLCIFVNTMHAAIFTAISSGNFNTSTTWAGGLVPPVSLVGDDIIIPLGLNVTMDRDVVLQSASSLTVNGSLTGSTGKFISMTTASLNGSGTINVDSFSAGFTTGFNFTGNLGTGVFYSTNAMINASATTNLLVKNTLRLTGGTMTIALGQLNFLPNATIVVNGGVITITGGTANLATVYHVIYKGAAATTGAELTGSGLTNVQIDIPATSNITLSNNMSLNGMLTLTSGILNLNSHDLVFDTLSNLDTVGSGEVATSATTSIYVFAKNGLSGKLQFYATGFNTAEINSLLINTDPGKSMAIGWPHGNLKIMNKLYLVRGMIDIQNFQWTIADTATIVGAGKSSYIITSHREIASGDFGWLRMTIDKDSTRVFPIGTPAYYAPVVLTNKANYFTNEFTAGVARAVKERGSWGALMSTTEPLVDATWNVTAQIGPNVTVDVTLMWESSMEANGFNRSKAYMSYYTPGKWTAPWDWGYWVPGTGSASTTNPNGLYSFTRSVVNGETGTYAMFDDNTTVSVEDVNLVSNVLVYPNPANDVLNITYSVKDNKEVKADIFNVTGQLMHTSTLNNGHSTIDINTLAKGMYYVRLSGEGAAVTQKFIKQ